MTPNPGLRVPNYLAGYPDEVQTEVRALIAEGVLAERLQRRYGEPHAVRTDGALYAYTMAQIGRASCRERV